MPDHSPVRVLHIVGSMNRGGVETWLMHMLRHLDRREIALDFLCLMGEAGAYGPEIENLGGRIHLLPLNRWRLDRFCRQFLALLARERYQVVHSHVLNFSGFLLGLARLAGVPKRLAHFHTSKVTTEGRPENFWRQLYVSFMKALMVRHATRLLACSRVAMAAVLGEDWATRPNAEVLYYGIDLSAFQKGSQGQNIREELGIPASVKVIGHVGSFIPAKNHQFLVQVAASIRARRKDFRFLLVGDGPLRKPIEQEIFHLGLSDFFVFTGVRGDVPRLMQAMDLFLLPSIREGLGIVLVEAQAAGLPLITSQLPAFQEVVFTPWHRALPPAEPEAWAQACEELLDLPKDTDRIMPQVWRGLERFSLEKCRRRLTEIYQV